ncbi:MAG: hypothetical protein U0271_16960 [Polyangiaceae bacterium]
MAEDLPLDEALAAASVDARRWSAARVAWLERIATDDAAFAVYQRARVKAEDELARSIEPLDSDVAVWVALGKLLAGSARADEVLASRGLFAADLSRTNRAWRERLRANPSLATRAANLAKEPSAPIPELRIGPRRAAKGQGTSPSSGAQGAAAPTPTLSVFDFAGLTAELERRADDPRILERYGLDARAHHDLEEQYQAAFREDRALERDYRALLEKARAGLRLEPASSRPVAIEAERAPLPIPPLVVAAASASGTLDVSELDLGGAPDLPFSPGAAATPAPTSLREQSGRTLDVSDAVALAEAPTVDAPQPLSLERYASLIVELEAAPHAAHATLTRYGLDLPTKKRLDAHYGESVANDPTSRARYWEARRAAWTWLQRQGRQR